MGTIGWVRCWMVTAGLTVILGVGGPGASRAADPGAPATVVRRVDGTGKVIALTIDDGYDTDTCLRLATILDRRGVAATFFPIGKNVRAHPDAWRSIAERYPVLNHTAYHGLLPPLSATWIRRQIWWGAGMIRRATATNPIAYLRPPGGAQDARVARIAGALGVRFLVTWDTTLADTALHSSPEAMLRTGLRGRAGSIVLMHCNRALSATLLPRLISGYQERGFRFVTIPELLELAAGATGAATATRRCAPVGARTCPS